MYKLEVEEVEDLVVSGVVVLEVNLMLILMEMVKHVMEMVVVDLREQITLVLVAVAVVRPIVRYLVVV